MTHRYVLTLPEKRQGVHGHCAEGGEAQSIREARCCGRVAKIDSRQNLWDDERRGDDDEEGDMDTDSFIEYSDEEEAGGNEEAREERRREKKQDAERRKRARRVRPELAGIDAKYVSLS